MIFYDCVDVFSSGSDENGAPTLISSENCVSILTVSGADLSILISLASVSDLMIDLIRTACVWERDVPRDSLDFRWPNSALDVKRDSAKLLDRRTVDLRHHRRDLPYSKNVSVRVRKKRKKFEDKNRD